MLAHRYGIVWTILAALTLCSFAMGVGDVPALSELAAGSAIIVIAGIKVRLIAWNFMELREAVLPLRLAFGAWLIGICAILIGLLAMAPR